MNCPYAEWQYGIPAPGAGDSRLQPRGKATIIAALAMVAPVGPPAMISCKPRQARKGATVAVMSCAGVWLAGAISIFLGLMSDAGRLTRVGATCRRASFDPTSEAQVVRRALAFLLLNASDVQRQTSDIF